MSGNDSDEQSRQDRLVKPRQRVADHGEVFTPQWMVDDMLNLVLLFSCRGFESRGSKQFSDCEQFF